MTNLTQAVQMLHRTMPQLVREWEPLAVHSTFHIGGRARLALMPRSAEELIACIRLCRENGVRFEIIGNGSNVLFADEGYDGAIIFTTACKEIRANTEDTTILCAAAGAGLGTLCREAQRLSLQGLEFACGIPGTVGGAVYMNAGAYGGEIGQLVTSVKYYDIGSDEIVCCPAAACAFDYRSSVFQTTDRIILEAAVRLLPGDREEITAQMQEHLRARNEKQPLQYPSAGSVFKRYPGYFTAQLIDEAGLKGRRIGGAQVSEKHAGFIVNLGGATAADVLALVQEIQQTVFEKNGIYIVCEIRYIH